MQYSNDISTKIDDSILILNQMIENAKSQGAQNFDMLHTLAEALKDLQIKVANKQKVDRGFTVKWDNVMGWVPKVFEDHPLLDLLRHIDAEIMASQ